MVNSEFSLLIFLRPLDAPWSIPPPPPRSKLSDFSWIFDHRKRTKSKFSTCSIKESTGNWLRLGSINQSSNMDSYEQSDTVHFTKIVFKKLFSCVISEIDFLLRWPWMLAIQQKNQYRQIMGLDIDLFPRKRKVHFWRFGNPFTCLSCWNRELPYSPCIS